jgi:hypothetical protein
MELNELIHYHLISHKLIISTSQHEEQISTKFGVDELIRMHHLNYPEGWWIP